MHLPQGIGEQPINKTIEADPAIGEILQQYDIGCVGCGVGICLLKDVVSIHALGDDIEAKIEHDQGRTFVRALEEAAGKALDGKPGQISVIAENAKSYAELLRGHIDKEDSILYPLAERILPEEVRPGMQQAYTHAGEKTPGLAEKYRRLVEHYEHQAAA